MIMRTDAGVSPEGENMAIEGGTMCVYGREGGLVPAILSLLRKAKAGERH